MAWAFWLLDAQGIGRHSGLGALLTGGAPHEFPRNKEVAKLSLYLSCPTKTQEDSRRGGKEEEEAEKQGTNWVSKASWT